MMVICTGLSTSTCSVEVLIETRNISLSSKTSSLIRVTDWQRESWELADVSARDGSTRKSTSVPTAHKTKKRNCSKIILAFFTTLCFPKLSMEKSSIAENLSNDHWCIICYTTTYEWLSYCQVLVHHVGEIA